MVDKDQQAPQSYIQIIFQDIGSTIFSTNVNGVTPLQFLALAEYLKVYGERAILKEIMKQEVEAERSKIVVPDGILMK